MLTTISDQQNKRSKRTFSTKKTRVIKEKINKLLVVDIVKPCAYPSWQANVVMVKKSNGQWRTCVDFTTSKACPEDCYPLTRIDQLIDSTSGHAMLSFMDAY